jgi:hypothetical protein
VTPTARSLALLRRSGYLAEVVERWIPRANRRRDLFHLGDVLGVHRHRQPAFLLVQATSLANVSSRVAKARSRPEVSIWLRAGGAFEVQGWTCRAGRWEVKRVSLSIEELEPMVLQAPARRRPKSQQPELF